MKHFTEKIGENGAEAVFYLHEQVMRWHRIRNTLQWLLYLEELICGFPTELVLLVF